MPKVLPRQQRGSFLFQALLSLALLAGALGVFLNRQQIYDQVMAWQYQPTAEMARIRQDAAFSDHGGFLFYASRPELLGRDAFNSACRSAATEQTAVVGCYAGNQIFLFNIQNEKLNGIKEVTAAHEMLHAAYQRLSPRERSTVDAMLEKQSFGPDEERINNLLAEYAKSEPGERLNELHSILGSEVGNLSPDLEAYYGRYFRNRAAVVNLSNKYQSVFAELQARQGTLVQELNDLADSIDHRGAVYKRNLQVLESDIEAFNRDASSGQMSRADYDRQRAALENRQASLRREYTAIQDMISEYNQKRSELAAINTESDALNRSINSSVTPVPEGISG